MTPITGGPSDPPAPQPPATRRAALDAAQARMEAAWHAYTVTDTGQASAALLDHLYDAYLKALDAWIWAVRDDQRQCERAGEGA